jgi:hypothetical protein
MPHNIDGGREHVQEQSDQADDDGQVDSCFTETGKLQEVGTEARQQQDECPAEDCRSDHTLFRTVSSSRAAMFPACGVRVQSKSP